MMPDVFLYQVKVFVPGAGPSDAILLDVEKYNPPYYKEGKHGEEVKFTPKELGIHFVSKGMKPSKKTSEQIEEEALVILAEQRYTEELVAREEEDQTRRETRKIERAQRRLRKVEGGEPIWKADAEERMRDGIIAKNTAEKERLQKLEDQIRLRNRLRMARIRAKRKK